MGKRSRDASSSPSESMEPFDPRTPLSEVEDDHIAKVVAVISTTTDDTPVMTCDLPPHTVTLKFSSIEAFEVHYAQDHTNRCSTCGRNLPSDHFLTLHIDENHNPIREALTAKGEQTYACLVPDCERKCSTPQKRRLHVIDKHYFSKFYNFRIIDYGIDNVTSLLREGRRRRVSTSINPPIERPNRISQRELTGVHRLAREQAVQVSDSAPPPTNKNSDDDIMKELETSLSALHFVPRRVAARQSQKKVHHRIES